eukprot:CAMPEP_0119119880 /NCGR_PEP_ID=MMETSP1310-20130426/1181_1 /TAXON_ID=464262 /ORGANISM="Genus nov. species nov., Strain RCC2339" /LENGTH=826 /DNA_ID=CAMNT_0007109339 /DNA_START=48 /DNA_END=2525 /DNA_ORIENTATION=-
MDPRFNPRPRDPRLQRDQWLQPEEGEAGQSYIPEWPELSTQGGGDVRHEGFQTGNYRNQAPQDGAVSYRQGQHQYSHEGATPSLAPSFHHSDIRTGSSVAPVSVLPSSYSRSSLPAQPDAVYPAMMPSQVSEGIQGFMRAQAQINEKLNMQLEWLKQQLQLEGLERERLKTLLYERTGGQRESIPRTQANTSRKRKESSEASTPVAKRARKEEREVTVEKMTLEGDVADDIGATPHTVAELKEIPRMPLREYSLAARKHAVGGIKFCNHASSTVGKKHITHLFDFLLLHGVTPSWITVQNSALIAKVTFIDMPLVDKKAIEKHSTLVQTKMKGCRQVWIPALTTMPVSNMVALGPKNKYKRNPTESSEQLSKERYLDEVVREYQDHEYKVAVDDAADIILTMADLLTHNFPVVSSEESSGVDGPPLAGTESLVPPPPFRSSRPALDDAMNQLRMYTSLLEQGGKEAAVPPASIGSFLKPNAPIRLFAIDCEMCMTNAGLELTRVSVVNDRFELVYDTFVCPDNPITDYLTEYSGVTEELLYGVETKLSDVQNGLIKLLEVDNAILVGHSLENDMKALRIYHPFFLDTSVLYVREQTSEAKSSAKLPLSERPRIRKHSLKHLARTYLRCKIQENSDGHCSTEDAQAALALVLAKMMRGKFFGEEGAYNVAHHIAHAGGICGVIARNTSYMSQLASSTSDAVHRAITEDRQILEANSDLVTSENVDFLWVELADGASSASSSYVESGETSKERLIGCLDCVTGIIEKSPPNTLFIVSTGSETKMQHNMRKKSKKATLPTNRLVFLALLVDQSNQPQPYAKLKSEIKRE